MKIVSLKEIVKHFVVYAICFSMISPSLVLASTPCIPSPIPGTPEGADSEYCQTTWNPPFLQTQIAPVIDSIDHVPPTPTTPEVFKVKYVDKRDMKSYDVTANLTTAKVTVLDATGKLIAARALLPSEVQTLRAAGQSVDNAVTAAPAFSILEVLGAIAAGLVLLAATSMLDEVEERAEQRRECNQQMLANSYSMANDAAACSRSGGAYKVDNPPLAEICGGGVGHCEMK